MALLADPSADAARAREARRTSSPTRGPRSSCDRIPGSKLADVSDASHMVAGDQNDSFSTAVVDFLQNDVRPILPT